MRKILITGGAGFLGSILKKELIKEGNFCVSIDLEKDDYKNEKFIAIQGDIRDETLLNLVFSENNFDVVLHCAAMLAHDQKNKKNLWTSNVDGTKNIVKYAEKYNCKQIQFISSNCLWGQDFKEKVTENEEPNPVELYGKTKLEGEKILLNSKINTVIFRCPTIIDEGRLRTIKFII